MPRWSALIFLLVSFSASAAGGAVLVTAVNGEVRLGGKATLEAFVRLRPQDRVFIPAAAGFSLVYIDSGRLENWQGAGELEIGAVESRALSGRPKLDMRRLPPEVARLMNRTPGPQDGRVGTVRLVEAEGRGELIARAEVSRSAPVTRAARGGSRIEMGEMRAPAVAAPLPSPEDGIDATYRQLRSESRPDDLTPEIYLLAALFDLRRFDRLEQELDRIAAAFPNEARVARLRDNYRQAIAIDNLSGR